MRTRLTKELRKKILLHAAIELSKEITFTSITRDAVAERAGVSTGLVSYYFSDISQLKREVMTEAVDRGIVEIVAQGLGVKDPIATQASQELKKRALRYMTS